LTPNFSLLLFGIRWLRVGDIRGRRLGGVRRILFQPSNALAKLLILLCEQSNLFGLLCILLQQLSYDHILVYHDS